MIPIAIILEWKLGQTYFDASCRTASVNDEMQITRWNASAAGRQKPDNTEIEMWRQEWEAAGEPIPDADRPLDAEELYDMLVTKGTLKDTDRPRPKPKKPIR